jgi:hypothetical protein
MIIRPHVQFVHLVTVAFRPFRFGSGPDRPRFRTRLGDHQGNILGMRLV